MKVIPLGTGSLFSEKSFHNNFLFQFEDTDLLVDAGTTIRYSLKCASVSFKDIDDLFITHFHPDHAGGLAEFLHFCRWNKEDGQLKPHRPRLLMTPEQHPLLSRILETEMGDYSFNLTDYCTPVFLSETAKGCFQHQLGNYLLEVWDTRGLHVPGVLSYALKITNMQDGTNILFSSDIKQLDQSGLIDRLNDLTLAIFQDVSLEESPVHSGIGEVTSYYPSEFHGRIFAMHYGDEIERAIEQTFKHGIGMARQGNVIDLSHPDSSDVVTPILSSDPQPQSVKEELNPEALLETIFHHTLKIANEKNVNTTLMTLADMGRDMICADRCTLWLCDEKTNELWTKVAHGVEEIRVPMDKGIVGHAVRTGKPIRIDDAYQDERFNPDVDRKTGYRTQSILVIPIHNQAGKLIGAFQAINKMTPEAVFTDTDFTYLSLAATYAARSIETAMLNDEIEETQKDILLQLGEVAESRSRETGNHVKRVAEYSWLLAIRSGMDSAQAELLRMASPMHDIGKIAIPDSVLNKPGKLTAEEYDVMKKHTTIGYHMLKNSSRPMLKAAATIAHEHHEKWNGAGYPRGIAGEDIHIFARITAIADVFDALGSARVYKPAWELERILDLFREERGRHFDPQLMDIFLDHVDDFVKIRDKYQDVFADSIDTGEQR